MANTLQKRAKRISLVLTLAAVLFTVVDNYLYLCHDINITPVATPVIIILVVSIVLCGVLQRYIYRWLIKYSLSPSVNRQKLEADKTEHTRAVVTEQAENRAPGSKRESPPGRTAIPTWKDTTSCWRR